MAIVAVLALLSYFKGVLADWFWFNSIGYSGIFITVLIAQLSLFIVDINNCAISIGRLTFAIRPRTKIIFFSPRTYFEGYL